ncbi:MAG: hypothetical protein JNK82_43655 [Myxococcaceae bacterium]|nr:hypothetical protein [Myxococcaceae bacterium]
MTRALVDEVLRAGEASWPGVVLSRAALAGHLQRLGAAGPAHYADAYLAAAVVEGIPAAQVAADAILVRAVRRCARRVGEVQAFVPEALQALRLRLFTARDGRGSALLGYDGAGPLNGWLRTAAVRELLRQRGLKRHDDALDTGVLERLPAEERDPELSMLRATLRPHFKAALRAALDHLPARERALLLLVYLDGVALTDLSKMYRQHRVTLARHLAAARQSLMLETRRRLSDLSGVPESDLAPLMAAVQTGLTDLRALLQ